MIWKWKVSFSTFSAAIYKIYIPEGQEKRLIVRVKTPKRSSTSFGVSF